MKGKALQLSPEAHQAAVQAQRLLATGRAADCLRFLQSRPAPLRKAAVLLHLEGLAAFHLGRMEAAVEAFEAAAKAGLEAAPLFSDLGIARLKRGEPGPAAEAFRRAAKLEPTKAGHLDNLGKALAAAKDRDGAIRAFRKAIKLAPDDGRIAFNLGALLVEEGLLREAREPLARAHALLPGEPRIAANFARALNDQGEFDEAKAVLAPALARHPGDADLLNTLGAVMMEMGDRTGAEAVFKQAIEAAPDYAPAWLNLANLLDQLRRCDEGMVAVERVLALESENFRALSLQYGLKFSLCEWDDAYRAARAKLDAVLFEADPPVQESVMQVTISRDDPAWTDRAARRRAGRWTVGDVCDTKLRRKQARKDGQRPLKVAYFSPDFRDHPVAHLIHPLFGLHDRSRVTVTAYGLGKAEDGFYAQAVASGADHFHQFGFAKADVIAKTIAEDGIDILVDLAGHTDGNRLDALALKPAPIQMTWLGFPGTTGANYIDYILTDEIVTPEEHQPFYAEKPIWLQGCYLAGDPTMLDIPEPTPRKTLGLAEDAVVLASLNSPFKLTPDLMDTWLAILAADDRCQLWLRAGAASMQANLRARAEAAAINPDRIVFAGHVDTKADHMARLQAADIALDPFIYNGHTTSLDCLMAGLAVVTKPGGHFASRVTLSQLTQVGLAEELAVDTVEAYRAKVLELAAAPARAKALGAKARQALQAGALCLNADFARQLETAYEAAWAAFKDGKSPRPIAL